MFIDALRLTELLMKHRFVMTENGNPVIVTDRVAGKGGKHLAYIVTKEQFAERLMYDEEGVKHCRSILEKNGIAFEEVGPELIGSIDMILEGGRKK